MIVSANRAAQIRSAVAYAKDRKLKLILYGGYEAMDCAELLVAEKVPVIVAGVYRLPIRRDLPYDDAYTLPARLHQAGIPFCIATAEDLEEARSAICPIMPPRQQPTDLIQP